MRWRFLDPAAKQVHPDWDEATALAVGGLRALFAEDPDDARLRALIDELSSSNERFTQRPLPQLFVAVDRALAEILGDFIARLHFWDFRRGPGPAPPTAGAP